MAAVLPQQLFQGIRKPMADTSSYPSCDVDELSFSSSSSIRVSISTLIQLTLSTLPCSLFRLVVAGCKMLIHQNTNACSMTDTV